MFIHLPLHIADKGLAEADTEKASVDAFLQLLMSTPCHSCVADPNFGFVFNNLRFEIFNETEGVVYDSEEAFHDNNDVSDLYVKKISGSSKNLNTFAAELKKSIETYEKRLTNVVVSMTYIRETKNIYVTVRGILAAGQQDYQYSTNIKIWN